MNAVLEALGDRLKGIPATFATWSTVGAFILYVLGYLSLRFHLTALGVGTDLTVLDERYLFSGAKFLVYLAATVPTVLMVGAIPLAILGGLLARAFPRGVGRVRALAGSSLPFVTIVGLTASVLFIQLVMRKCFLVSNLLLGEGALKNGPWPTPLLLTDGGMSLYFGALVAGVALPVVILLSRGRAGRTPAGPLRVMLWVLVAIQVLFLPVNYGTLILDKTFPRVATLGPETISAGDAVWLVWEGKEGVTYLVRRAPNRRSLVTLPRQDIKRTEIMAYDSLATVLAAPEEAHVP